MQVPEYAGLTICRSSGFLRVKMLTIHTCELVSMLCQSSESESVMSYKSRGQVQFPWVKGYGSNAYGTYSVVLRGVAS